MLFEAARSRKHIHGIFCTIGKRKHIHFIFYDANNMSFDLSKIMIPLRKLLLMEHGSIY